jgi:hypothetical protein
MRMPEEHWICFDRHDPTSFPPPDLDVIVETESGQTFPARFIQKKTDFSLRYALWGNQGGVTRCGVPGLKCASGEERHWTRRAYGTR